MCKRKVFSKIGCRCVFVSCIVIESIFNTPIIAHAADLSLSAKSAVVISADRGEILYGKNEFDPRPMASTTKIMTALLTLEAAQSEDIKVTITNKMVPVEGSSMYLQVGQALPLSGLAKGMLTVSGNDAANSAAITVGGSIEGFVNMMNKKAEQIGMKDTHFETPSGLDKGNHHSTAYDMAILGAYALENEAFFDIASKRKSDVHFLEPDEVRTYHNKNKMLKRYDGCIGIKTGFTKHAGRCLVSAAERNNVRLVAVTLNAGDDWNDHEKLLDYGFSQVESVDFSKKNNCFKIPVVGGNVDEISANIKEKTEVTVKKSEKDKLESIVEIPKFLYSPVKQGQIVGKVKCKIKDKVIADYDIVSEVDVPVVKQEKNLWQKICDFFVGLFN